MGVLLKKLSELFTTILFIINLQKRLNLKSNRNEPSFAKLCCYYQANYTGFSLLPLEYLALTITSLPAYE